MPTAMSASSAGEEEDAGAALVLLAADLPARGVERDVGDREQRGERDGELAAAAAARRARAGRAPRGSARRAPGRARTRARMALGVARVRCPPAGGAYGCAAPTGASSRACGARGRRASGSAASVIARTTTMRRAPSATTAGRRVLRRGRRSRTTAWRRARRPSARSPGPRRGGRAWSAWRARGRRRGSRRPGRRRPPRPGPAACVERPTIASGPTTRAGGGGRAVVLADVDAVGAAGGDEVGPVVEDEERAVRVGGGPELARRRDQGVVAERLVAQLDDVGAAAQGGLEEGARARVADEVQAGGGDALARGHAAPVKQLPSRPLREPAIGLRGRHRGADRRT